MASNKSVRRMAFQALFQLDARNGADVNSVRDALSDEAPRSDELEEAMKLALAVWSTRAKADAAMTALAPNWPAHRQAAVDRAILRLGHYELLNTSENSSPPKVVVNDLVALAKEYSTEKSPAFVNALLDKILRESTPSVSLPTSPEPEGQ